jgi:hypothetical protein
MGSIFTPKFPNIPTPAPATPQPTAEELAKKAAEDARDRERRSQATIATSWRGLVPDAQYDALFRRKSLLGE